MHGGHLRANGIRQHFLRFDGAGECVLVVPGIVSPAILWAHVATALCGERECRVLDVRGRGLSESGPHLDYGFDACAGDLVAFVRALDRKRLTVVGHSMGARIALRAGAEAPELFEHLVLVDPPTSGPGRRPYPIPKSRTLDLLRAAHRGEALQALRDSRAGRPWPDDLLALRAEWLATCDERAVHAAYDDFHAQDLFEDLARCRVPASLIHAGEGGVVSDDDVAEMRELRPDLRTTRLDGVGHQMQAEDPDAFVGALRRVLEEAPRHTNERSAP